MKPSSFFGTLLAFLLLFAVGLVLVYLNPDIFPSLNKTLVLGAGGLVGAATILFGALTFGSIAGEIYIRNDISQFANIEKINNDRERELIESLDEHSKAILNHPPNTLYYVDKLEVENLYSLYFDDSTVTGITSETFGETSNEITAAIPNVGGAMVGGKDSSKITQNIKPAEMSITKKFYRIQRAVILKQQIIVGLELVDVDLSSLKKMENDISNLQKEYGLNLSSSQIEISEKRTELMRDGAKGTIKRLEDAKGLVLLDSKFLVTEENGKYVFVYTHPVNEYLADKENIITIRFTLPTEALNQSADDFSQIVGKIISLKVFAKLLLPLDTKTGNWSVVIKPIGVY